MLNILMNSLEGCFDSLSLSVLESVVGKNGEKDLLLLLKSITHSKPNGLKPRTPTGEPHTQREREKDSQADTPNKHPVKSSRVFIAQMFTDGLFASIRQCLHLQGFTLKTVMKSTNWESKRTESTPYSQIQSSQR